MKLTCFQWLRTGFLSLGITLFFAGAIVLLLRGVQYSAPQFSHVSEHFEDGSLSPTKLFYWHDNAPFGAVKLTFTLTLPRPWSPKVFSVMVRQVIDSLTVNGHDIPYDPRTGFDMRDYLKPGPNDVAVSLHSSRTKLLIFHLQPSFFTLQQCVYTVLSILLVLFWAGAFLYLRIFPKIETREVFLFALGIVLCTLYLTATPYFLRSHDWWGHLPYIDYLRHTWTVPVVGSSWQAHQPPLGYVPYAVALNALSVTGLDEVHTLVFLQYVSLCMVVSALAIGLSVIRRLSPDPSSRFLSSMLYVTFLPMTVLSSQISNDVLLAPLGCLWTALLLSLAKSQYPWKTSVGIGLCIGLGLLTKFNAIAWLFVTLLLLPIMLLKRKVLAISFGTILSIALLLPAPLWAWRHFTHQILDPVANSQLQQGTMPLTVSASQLLTFNPIDLVRAPMIDASTDSRSTHFFESLFRKSLVLSSLGTQESSYLILFGLCLLPLFFWSSYRFLRQRSTAPIPLIIFLGFLALLLFRMMYPYSTAQHTRYILFIFLPLALLLGQGAHGIRSIFLRALADMLIVFFSLVSALTIVAISIV